MIEPYIVIFRSKLVVFGGILAVGWILVWVDEFDCIV
jgi:hypothetical protein